MRETGDTLNPIEFPPKTGATSRVAKGTIERWGTCDPAANGFQPTTDYILGPGIPGSPATGLRRWGGGGEQLTEMAMDENGEMAWQHTNVWAAGQLVATYDRDSVSPTGPSGPHYHLSDWLGTRRVQTDASGAIEATCTSLPYGDALNCTGPAFTTEHHFTGKERDQESGNDYFGARYYASSEGRFVSPDPLFIAPHRLKNPQTLNLYHYGDNNPLRYIDPLGLDEHLVCNGFGGQACASAKDDTIKDFGNRKNKQFDVGIDASGKLTQNYSGDLSKLSIGEKALYDAITDPEVHAILTINQNDPMVNFGKFMGGGVNILDRHDLDLLRKASLDAAGETVSHEAVEAYKSASLTIGPNLTFDQAFRISHVWASQFFGPAVFSVAAESSADHEERWDFGRINESFIVSGKMLPQQPGMYYQPFDILDVTKVGQQ